jgi:NDP-sugar pyrophosphorylase family protein
VQCVILAGGLGTRIRERAGDLPKALIPVLGKPFVFYQLEWLARQAVRHVVLSVSYRGELIADAVGDGSQFGLSVVCANEGDAPRGTGGALRFIADMDLLDPGFFILYGDSYLPIDLAPVWNTSHGGSRCTMTVMRNRGKWDKSNVLFQDGELVLYDKFAADPAALGMQHIDYGLSVLTRDAIREAFAPQQTADLAPLLNRLSREKRLRGHEVFERFYEIGSPRGLDDFVAYVRSGKPPAPVSGQHP